MTKREVDLSPGNLHGYRYYQASNGGVYMTTPNGQHTPLTRKQLDDLSMSLNNLPDFDLESFKRFYQNQGRGSYYGVSEP